MPKLFNNAVRRHDRGPYAESKKKNSLFSYIGHFGRNSPPQPLRMLWQLPGKALREKR